MKKYRYLMSWTLADGTRVINQVFTGEAVSRILAELEKWGAKDIELKLETAGEKERTEK